MLVVTVVLTAFLMLMMAQMQPKKAIDISESSEGTSVLYSDTVREISLSGYTQQGTELFPVNADPQLYLDASEAGNMAGITLLLSEKAQEKLAVQVFYDDGSGISEEKSQKGECAAGENRLDIKIPKGNYKLIRVDIDASSNIPVESIVAWSSLKSDSGPAISWMLCAGLFLLLFAGICLMNLGGKGRTRIGFLFLLLIGSLVFVITLKARLGIDEAFFAPDKLLVTIWDIVFTMLSLFWILSCFRPVRSLFGLKDSYFSGMEKIFLVLCFAVYSFWTLAFPGQNYGPDEYMRYDIPKFILQTGALPCGWEESIRNPYWGVSYGFDISLPYLFSAWLMEMMTLYSSADSLLLIAARMGNLISTVGVAAMAILISKKLLQNNPIRWLYIVLMSLLPQVVFLSSYVNLDSFSLLTVMMIIYCWIICLEKEWSIQSCIWLALSIGLCFLSYKFAYGYILMSAVLYLVWYVINRKTVSFSVFIRRGLLIVGIALVICGWKFIRSAILYNGDFLSLNASKPYSELYAAEGFRPSDKVTYAGNGVGMIEMLQTTPWIRITGQSLMGVFGYLNIFFPGWIYSVYNYLFLTGLISSVLIFFKRKKKIESKEVLLYAAMGFASFAAFFISVYNSWSWDYQAQGRYIISILPFVFLLISKGYGKLTELVFPRKLQLQQETVRVIVVCITGFVCYTMFAGFMECLNYFGIIQF